MHPLTRAIAKEIRGRRTIVDHAAVLRSRYAGDTCVVVSCGPSLADMDHVRLRSALDGVLTIAVKQAVEIVGDQTDFHCWNTFNVTRYPRPSESTIRCFVAEPTGTIRQWNEFDLEFPNEDGMGDLSRSLARNRNFSDHHISDIVKRPFGPGIMYELVLYLAVHLGVSRIITVGWDIADAKGKNTHYFDSTHDQAFFEAGRVSSVAPRLQRRTTVVPTQVRSIVRMLRTRLAHQRGRMYNRTQSLIGESDLVADSMPDLVAWLAEQGVEMSAVTDSPYVGGGIERLSAEQFFDRLDGLRSR